LFAQNVKLLKVNASDGEEEDSGIILDCLGILRNHSFVRKDDRVITVQKIVPKVVRIMNPIGKSISPLASPPSYKQTIIIVWLWCRNYS